MPPIGSDDRNTIANIHGFGPPKHPAHASNAGPSNPRRKPTLIQPGYSRQAGSPEQRGPPPFRPSQRISGHNPFGSKGTFEDSLSIKASSSKAPRKWQPRSMNILGRPHEVTTSQDDRPFSLSARKSASTGSLSSLNANSSPRNRRLSSASAKERSPGQSGGIFVEDNDEDISIVSPRDVSPRGVRRYALDVEEEDIGILVPRSDHALTSDDPIGIASSAPKRRAPSSPPQEVILLSTSAESDHSVLQVDLEATRRLKKRQKVRDSRIVGSSPRPNSLARAEASLSGIFSHSHHSGNHSGPSEVVDLDAEADSDHDSIESWSPPNKTESSAHKPSRSQPAPSPGRAAIPDKGVSKKIEAYTKLDLSVPKMRTSGIASSMKPKNAQFEPLSRSNGVDPLASGTAFTSKASSRKGKGKSANTTEVECIQVQQWALDDEIQPESPDGEQLWLTWHAASKTITLLLGNPSSPREQIHSWNVDRDIDWFTYDQDMRIPVVQLAMRSASGATTGRKGVGGCITYKIQPNHANTEQLYASICSGISDALKKVQRSASFTRGGKVWEAIKASGFQLVSEHIIKHTKPLMSEFSDDELEKSPPRPNSRAISGLSSESAVSRTAQALRRSTRSRAQGQAQMPSNAPLTDPDELILMYPLSGTGAVNITRMDRSRLAPGEFLNDNLIEFGFKWWLNDLRGRDPVLADQIYVASSFFYKKLSSSKNPEEGFASVRKWTSKVDIFQKKYIIVPINEHLHWYLAIIYQPEHILLPRLPEVPRETILKTRNQKRQSEAFEAEAMHARPSRDPSPASAELDPNPGTRQPTRSPTPDPNAPIRNPKENEGEAADERRVEGLLRSFSIIEDSPSGPSSATPLDLDSGERHASEPAGVETGQNMMRNSPSVVDDEPLELTIPDSEAPQYHPMDVDEDPNMTDVASYAVTSSVGAPVETVSAGSSEPTTRPASPAPTVITAGLSRPKPPLNRAVSTIKFYGGSSASVERNLTSSLRQETTPSVEFEADAEDDVVVDGPHDGRPQTYIFTLDSLGSQHRKASSLLNEYLQMEAQDKKGIKKEDASKAICKSASVPTQPNFCDCGVYLLHFAMKFMEDPPKFKELSLRTGKKVDAKQRETEWKGAEVASLRDTLGVVIDQLSEEWRKDRNQRKLAAAATDANDTPISGAKSDSAQARGEKQIREESDDEIEMTGHTIPPPKPRPVPRRVGKGAAATRVKGKGKGREVQADQKQEQ